MNSIDCQLEVVVAVALMSFQVSANDHLCTSNGPVFARNFFKLAPLAMVWEIASCYAFTASLVFALYLYHGAYLKVNCNPLLILSNLIAVWALILSPWTLLLYMRLQVSAKQPNSVIASIWTCFKDEPTGRLMILQWPQFSNPLAALRYIITLNFSWKDIPTTLDTMIHGHIITLSIIH